MVVGGWRWWIWHEITSSLVHAFLHQVFNTGSVIIKSPIQVIQRQLQALLKSCCALAVDAPCMHARLQQMLSRIEPALHHLNLRCCNGQAVGEGQEEHFPLYRLELQGVFQVQRAAVPHGLDVWVEDVHVVAFGLIGTQQRQCIVHLLACLVLVNTSANLHLFHKHRLAQLCMLTVSAADLKSCTEDLGPVAHQLFVQLLDLRRPCLALFQLASDGTQVLLVYICQPSCALCHEQRELADLRQDFLVEVGLVPDEDDHMEETMPLHKLAGVDKGSLNGIMQPLNQGVAPLSTVEGDALVHMQRNAAACAVQCIHVLGVKSHQLVLLKLLELFAYILLQLLVTFLFYL
mmetsp:Transcript_2991/g.7823  ORF Transcript_2991/g.7823 Transcript_2991/m.7823 type:complete len:347 (-) Transcript_2991:972-2012(-)